MMSLPLDDNTYDKPVGGGTMYTYGFHDGDSIFTANNVTMNDMIRIDGEYIEWLKNIKSRFKMTQIKASIKVNDEMLSFYWLVTW